MTDKSYVTMEQHLCVVCLDDFDTGTILMDRRLRERFNRYTRTGWGMCPACAKKRDDGFVALIECDPVKTKMPVKDPGDAYRLGTVVHIRKEAFAKIFNCPVPEKMVAFTDPEVVKLLNEINQQPKETTDGNADNQPG